LADWYVYEHDGDHRGPWSTERIAEAILTGEIGQDAWVAAPGGSRWVRALDVPVIASLVDGLPTRPRRRDSGLRLAPGYASPDYLSTVMMVKDDEIAPASAERDTPEAPPTDRCLPPPFPPPHPPTPTDADTIAVTESRSAAGAFRRRRGDARVAGDAASPQERLILSGARSRDRERQSRRRRAAHVEVRRARGGAWHGAHRPRADVVREADVLHRSGEVGAEE
jgi:hypothetical protein